MHHIPGPALMGGETISVGKEHTLSSEHDHTYSFCYRSILFISLKPVSSWGWGARAEDKQEAQGRISDEFKGGTERQ